MLENLDPRTKLTLVFGVSVFAVVLDRPFSLLLLLILTLLGLWRAKPRASLLKGTFLMALLTSWGLIVSQGIFYQNFPRSILFFLVPPFELFGFSFPGLPIYRQGLYYGAVQSLRFNAAMFAGLALCFSTSPEKLYRVLSAMPFPRGLSFLAVTAVRFLPLITQEFDTVRKAQRLKGYHPFKTGVLQTIWVELSVPLPVLAGAIRKARELSDALLTRGFDPLASTNLLLPPWPRWEKIGAILFVLFAFICLAIKLLFWLYLQDIFYLESWRGLYSLARNWL